jgi:hypothetical protein
VKWVRVLTVDRVRGFCTRFSRTQPRSNFTPILGLAKFKGFAPVCAPRDDWSS